MLEGSRGKMRDEAVKGGKDIFSSGLRQYVDCMAITNVTGQYIASIFSVKDEAVYSFLMVLINCQIADVIFQCRVLKGRERKVVTVQ
jgi:hypothetical protein